MTKRPGSTRDQPRARARGNVFEGQEEQLSAAAVLSTHRGFGGTIFRIDARDPRNVVLKIKIQLRGEPEFIAKIKAFEDSIENRASVRGVIQGPQKECIDARREFDPPDLPAHPPWRVH